MGINMNNRNSNEFISDNDTNSTDSMTYSDSSSMTDDISQDENDHLDSEKIDNMYYIGICTHISEQYNNNYYLYMNSVSPKTFLNYSYNTCYDYLYQYSIIRIRPTNIEIMKLQIMSDYTYSVVIKTHWIRLVQRHWKKVFSARNDIINKRRTIQSIRSFELSGKYPAGLNSFPTINGMMNCYKSIEKAF